MYEGRYCDQLIHFSTNSLLKASYLQQKDFNKDLIKISMKNKIIYFIVYASAIILPCNNNVNHSVEADSIFEVFDRKKKLEYNILNLSFDEKLQDLLVMKDRLLLLTQNPDTLIQIHSLHNYNETLGFGRIGKGDHEFVRPIKISKVNGQSFYIREMGVPKLHVFDINKVLRMNFGTSFLVNTGSLFDSHYLNNNQFVKKTEKLECSFKLVNNSRHNDSTLSCFGELYTFKGLVPDEYSQNILLQPKINSSYDDKYLICTYSSTPYFQIYKKRSDETGFEIFKTFKFGDISFVPNRPSARKPDNITGFLDACISDKYICLLYSGRTTEEYNEEYFYCNYLAIFDLEGNPIDIYQTERDMTKLCYWDTKKS